jgi:hypothetical protein
MFIYCLIMTAATMKSIRFIFLAEFISEIQSYFLDGPIIATLMKSAKNRAIESAKGGAEAIAANVNSETSTSMCYFIYSL